MLLRMVVDFIARGLATMMIVLGQGIQIGAAVR
jgi:hypothetical protein